MQRKLYSSKTLITCWNTLVLKFTLRRKLSSWISLNSGDLLCPSRFLETIFMLISVLSPVCSLSFSVLLCNKIKIINFDLPKSLAKSKTSSSSSSSGQIENFGFGQIWKKNSNSAFTISFLADPFDFGSILADPF